MTAQLAKYQLEACYEADVSAHPTREYIDISPILSTFPADWKVLLDAENTVIAIVPPEKAAVLVEILNEAAQSYPFREPRPDE